MPAYAIANLTNVDLNDEVVVERAHAWYDSPAYQEILPLRTENSDGATIIVEGVDEGYRAAAFVSG